MASVDSPPGGEFMALLAELERRVRAMERGTAKSVTFYGVRDDAPYAGGQGPRVMVGQLDDGTYGICRWTQAGVRQVVTWS